MKTILKTRKEVTQLLLFMLIFSISQNVSAQIAAATPENNWGGTQPFAVNTGNYLTELLGWGVNLGVTVWDGSNPGLGWDLAGATGVISLTPGINDPDVAMSNDGEFTGVVYELNGSIYWEGYVFDPVTMSLSSSTFPVMISNVGNSNASNPNIDGDGNGCVVVWSEDIGGVEKIFTRHIEFSVPMFYPIVDISSFYAGSGTNSIEPDVSVYESSGTVVYSYTYVNDMGTYLDVIYQIEEASNIISGSAGAIYYSSIINLHVDETPRFPRIASHLDIGYPFEYASAITFAIPSANAVMTYSTMAGLQTLTNGTLPSDLGLCYNRFPVICWASFTKEYIVGWRYIGGCSPVSSAAADLLSTKLDASGFLLSNNLLDYQWINDFKIGSQRGLSLASRHAVNGEIFSGFYSHNSQQVLYKLTNSMTIPSFRGVATTVESVEVETKLHVYPNPVHNVLSVRSAELTSVTLYNLTGQIVRSFDSTDLEQPLLNIPVVDLSSGIYLLKAEGNGKVYTEKITVE